MGQGRQEVSGRHAFAHRWSEHDCVGWRGGRTDRERRGHLLGRRAWACEVSSSPCGTGPGPAGCEGAWGGGGGGPGAEAGAAA